MNRRPHGVGIGGNRPETGDRLGFTRDLIDEMETDVAARPLIRHEWRQRGQPAPRFAGRQESVLLQSAENVGKPLLRAFRAPVRTKIVRTFREARQQCTLLKRELLCRLSEIAARGEFDAPRVATEINGIEIELENLIL